MLDDVKNISANVTSIRSLLFGFIKPILLIGLMLFYRTFSEITTQRRKTNLGKTRAESFSVYSVLGEGSFWYPYYIILVPKSPKYGGIIQFIDKNIKICCYIYYITYIFYARKTSHI